MKLSSTLDKGLQALDRTTELLHFETDARFTAQNRELIQQALANQQSTRSYDHFLSLETDRNKYNTTIETAVGLAYEVGYIERFLDIDAALKKDNHSGYLTDAQRVAWQEDLNTMRAQLEAVEYYLPESYSGHLSENAWKARRAGQHVAALEIDADRENRLHGQGTLTDRQEQDLRARAIRELADIRNNLPSSWTNKSR